MDRGVWGVLNGNREEVQHSGGGGLALQGVGW